MSFEQFLTTSFKNIKLQETTKNNYIKSILKIYNNLNLHSTNEEFFYYSDEIIHYINNLKFANSTKRSYYTNILKLLSSIDGFDSNVIKTYELQYQNYVKLEKSDAIEKSDKIASSIDKWCTLQELQTIPYLLVDDIINKFKLTKQGEYFFSGIFVNYDKYMSFDVRTKIKYLLMVQDFIVTYIHMIRVSLRLEFLTVIIVKEYDESLDNTNYILNSGDIMILHLNKFKNLKSFGKSVQILNTEERALINAWLNIHSYNNEFLINHGNDFDVIDSRILRTDLNTKLLYFNAESTYSDKIKALTKKYINKSLSCTIIRKIWETYFQTSNSYHSLTNQDKHKLHNQMLHTIGSATSKYNVYDPKNALEENDNELRKYIKKD